MTAEECVILAQVCSDAGKHKYDLYNKLRKNSAVEQAATKGYNLKGVYILKAINEINRGASNAHFYVCRDTEKVADFIIYFNFRINGKRRQASFHSYSGNFAAFVSGSVPHKTSWAEKSSRETCLELARKLGIAE